MRIQKKSEPQMGFEPTSLRVLEHGAMWVQIHELYNTFIIKFRYKAHSDWLKKRVL